MSGSRAHYSCKECGDRRCAEVASTQFGVISLSQARENGLSRDAVADRVGLGRWDRIIPAVYRMAGVPPSWRQYLMAAILWAGKGAASHRAAAALWELEGFAPGPVELSMTGGRNPIREWITIHRTSRLHPADITKVGVLPVTTPTRTIV